MSSRAWYQSSCGPVGGLSVPCKLCLEDFPPDHMTTISQCRCVFCTLCLRRYVDFVLSEGLGSKVGCPDSACPEQALLLDTEVEAAAPDAIGRYRRLRDEKEILLDPYRTWCPALACQAVCQLVGAESAPRTAVCPACGLKFCSACRAQLHPGRPCPDPPRTLSCTLPGENRSLLGGEGGLGDPVKPCPGCQIYIEKDQGCAQMVCKNCKHSFCWLCLDSLDGDFLLRHYDKGSCRNKLGHSRAAVIWHRAQVIGMAAGFGVVMLAASPLLLLATPLLFCCRWTCSRRAHKPLPAEQRNPRQRQHPVEPGTMSAGTVHLQPHRSTPMNS